MSERRGSGQKRRFDHAADINSRQASHDFKLSQ
jgi:hypothetical protein